MTAILLLLLGDWRLISAIFAGVILTIILGALLEWTVCRTQPASGNATYGGAGHDGAAAGQEPVASSSATAAAAGVAAGGAGAAVAAAATTAESEEAEDAAASGAAPAEDANPLADDAAMASAPGDAATAAPETAEAEAVMKPSQSLPGEEELAARKGSWTYDGGASGDAAEPAKAAPEPTPAPAPAAEDPVAAAPVAAAPVAAAATTETGVDYDGDGVIEGTNEGARPETLDGPRGGKADDLKQIKGIGPKLEQLCNSLGFYHFDQIASWSADEVAWVDANLLGFKGRVSRDKWVEQAKVLASGGETAFSKRVEDGGVY
ncbi:endonuclease [Aliishimia ponticola]|uniref:endonuclease n=1 Tax=Aliishimia ponticola TaxID=2499833 RepID=UPI001FEBB484|nr:endonuclease [Aliishimia ponticola]